MNIQRIKAIIMQELFITVHSLETINDVFVVAIINFLLFGILSSYLLGSNRTQAAKYLLLGMILWEIVRIVQYSISVGSLWNIWSRNLSNLFISPLSAREYLSAHTSTALLKGFTVMLLAAVASIFAFHFNIFSIGIFNLFLDSVNLALFAFSSGIIILGFIFKYGTKIQALSWSIIPILQPLTANFYPLHIMPYPLQLIAYLFPLTFVFEAARANLVNPATQWEYMAFAFIENIIYLCVGILIFKFLFKSSKNTGQFARNET